jgi:serine-aspartate repeat-containing protein C/D/E
MYRFRAAAARIVEDMRKQSLLLILGITAEILCASTVAAGDGGNRQGRDNGAWHCAVVDGGGPPPSRQRSPFRATEARPASTTGGAAYDPADRAVWSLQLGAVRPPHAHRTYFGPSAGIPVAGDFNGDGYDELGMYVDGRWYVDLNGNGTLDAADLLAQLGTAGDRPIVGDWNQDGKADIGVFKTFENGGDGAESFSAAQVEPGLPHPLNDRTDVNKNSGVRDSGIPDAYVRTEALGTVRRRVSHVFRFGSVDDVPVVGDWQGSGVRSIGVFHAGEWTLDLDGDGKLTEKDGRVRLGEPGDIPVVGDFNRDGRDDLGVYRRGQWILDTTGDRRFGEGDLRLQLGDDDDTPVVGDWDGDGRDQIGIVHRGGAS